MFKTQNISYYKNLESVILKKCAPMALLQYKKEHKKGIKYILDQTLIAAALDSCADLAARAKTTENEFAKVKKLSYVEYTEGNSKAVS